MSTKLNDTQLVLLSVAAQRDDRCLVPRQDLKSSAAQKVAAKLIAAGLVKEIKARAGMPFWQRDEQAGQSYALKLTAAGAKAISVDEGSASHEAGGEVGQREHAVAMAPQTKQQVPADLPATATALSRSAPRDGTKLAQVVELLQRDDGATLGELIGLTGWLPHTTRAALTGLRKRGLYWRSRSSDPIRREDRPIASKRIGLPGLNQTRPAKMRLSPIKRPPYPPWDRKRLGASGRREPVGRRNGEPA
jgi:hypothetical protein